MRELNPAITQNFSFLNETPNPWGETPDSVCGVAGGNGVFSFSKLETIIDDNIYNNTEDIEFDFEI